MRAAGIGFLLEGVAGSAWAHDFIECSEGGEKLGDLLGCDSESFQERPEGGLVVVAGPEESRHLQMLVQRLQRASEALPLGVDLRPEFVEMSEGRTTREEGGTEGGRGGITPANFEDRADSFYPGDRRSPVGVEPFVVFAERAAVFGAPGREPLFDLVKLGAKTDPGDHLGVTLPAAGLRKPPDGLHATTVLAMEDAGDARVPLLELEAPLNEGELEKPIAELLA